MNRDPAWGEPHKRLTLMIYDRGPAGYLGGQIVKLMQRVCYPASHIDDQSYREGIMLFEHEIHKDFQSEQSPSGEYFYETLSDCVEVISEKFQIEIIENGNGHYSLSGHRLTETQDQLRQEFEKLLPKTWSAYKIAQIKKEQNNENRSKLIFRGYANHI